MSLALAPVALLMTIQAASADELEAFGAAISKATGAKANDILNINVLFFSFI